jgi:predicted alpha/beta superfamily hydrolase
MFGLNFAKSKNKIIFIDHLRDGFIIGISFNFLLSLIVFISPYKAYTQTLIERQYVSKYTEDTVKYKVWVPRDWTPDGQYPSIYVNQYGALAYNGMLVAAHVNNFINSFPKSLVIEITSGDMKNMNYSYETGKVGKLGEHFILSLRHELIPNIERDFKATKFRAFIGQSYSGSYANYLFLNEPDLFNAYIVFTPERLNESQPKFVIDSRLIDYYKDHSTLYYVAPAGNDLDRRKEYAKRIQQEVSKLDSSNFHFKYELFSEADHNSIVSHSLLSALNYIFHFYNVDIESVSNTITAFKGKEKILKDLYGLIIPKNSKSQSSFLQLASNKKDTAGMDFVANYFQDSLKLDNALMLFNSGYVYYDTFHDFTNAEKYFRMSIESAKKHKNSIYLVNGYSWLSRMFLDGLKDIDKSWLIIEEGFEYTQSVVYKYKLGSLAAETGRNLDEGIRNLKYFLAKPVTSFPENQMFTEEGAYLLLSKCYYKKNKISVARKYVQMSLLLNEKYEPALQWKAQVKL